MVKNNFKIFMQEAVAELIKNRVSINLPFIKKVNSCSGFFDEAKMEFAVAMKKPQKQWSHIFIHEYCHFEQWKEQCLVWIKYSGEFLEQWLFDSIEINPKKLEKDVKSTQNLELDCEKRVVEKIKKYNLGFNIEQYVKKSNAYVYFYNIIIKYRKWYNNPPYENEKILNIMPSDFDNDYSVIPNEYEMLIKKYCF